MTCIFLCVQFSIKAQATNVGQQLIDAEQLVKNGNNETAILLLEKVLYNAPPDGLRYRVAVQLSKYYCIEKQYAFAIKTITDNITLQKDTAAQYNLYLQQCVVSLLSQDYEECLLNINKLQVIYPDSAHNADIMALNILALNGKTDWQAAKKSFGEFVAMYAPTEEQGKYENTYQAMPQLKSGKKAEGLSVVPIIAAGLWYAGKPQEAILNTLLQAGFVWFGIHQFIAKEYISAVLIGGGMYTSFYNGGTKRAINLIKKSNEKKIAEFNAQANGSILTILRNLKHK